MILSTDAALSKTQWIAIFIQLFGLILTQYKPENGTAYPISIYVLLLFQVFVSASSGVYNGHLLKTNENSPHADNMILYAAGAFVNLLCHVSIFMISADEPHFFQGYGDIRAILVVLSSVFIGFATTLVYKYADAVLKCFAVAASTAILLYASPILFEDELGSLVVPGTIIVFVASALYISYPAPPSSGYSTKHAARTGPLKAFKEYSRMSLALSTLGTIVIVAFLAMSKDKVPRAAYANVKPTHEPAAGAGNFSSPFRNVLAMVRWNTPYPERIPRIMEYQPFFDTVHISVPDMMPEQPPEHYNWTHDQFPTTNLIYRQVANMMKLVLAGRPDIKGLMYFHFDAWLDPLGWNDTDFDNMWFTYGHPLHNCMTNTDSNSWWGWKQDMHLPAKAAAQFVHQLGLDYQVNPDEWCIGWSDIYFIPRSFFGDFVLLAEIFERFDVFHEVATPTIAHIINNSRRSSLKTTSLDQVRDCWGSCCDSGPTVEDVLTAHCGHRLDYLNETVTDAFYKKLASQAQRLRPNLI
ncbi:nucleotide-sugar transporter [Hirsutella rhossiliensis]|uniref:Nucleotide-sugar transporter domain-containing protein n=1 Tax=Hirsutella rhossiliensis TaxID=111463 RepID=A0A9P8SJS2_9HYPO|nr:nucleotide-sugar transporter domain-containing protein [Hirsutella rhossiliensis]KAH0963336.1 nucleotide-sugar transporter domain-containing protein [Hirsutella rhossiliensis]